MQIHVEIHAFPFINFLRGNYSLKFTDVANIRTFYESATVHLHYKITASMVGVNPILQMGDTNLEIKWLYEIGHEDFLTSRTF